MKKLLLLSVLLIFACSTDSEGNPCIYEPTLTTEAATDITETSATLNGVISIVSENCDVPNNTEQGFVYSTEIQPTLEDIQVNVNGTNISTTIEGLTPNTTYYVRAFLTNNFGDFYGDEVSFISDEITGSCNGAPYPSIVYGTQEWTVENACNINYRDGTDIPRVTDTEEWVSLAIGAWCYYDNDPTKPRLYNWYAVAGIHDVASLSDPSLRKEFAPEGWHLPTDAEWTTLENHLIANGHNFDGTTIGNKIAKSMSSNTGWNSSTETGVITEPGAPGNNQSLNNSSGFNALPVGYRLYGGGFYNEGKAILFWSSTESSSGGVYGRYLGSHYSFVERGNPDLRNGLSVRFVRD
jgi:uncharacterized protein (TIGR02145 family)